MRTEEFIEDLAGYVDAQDTRDALTVVFGVRARSKDEALDRLCELIDAGRGDTVSQMVENMLTQVRAEDLRRWTNDVFGEACTKNEAVRLLTSFYLASPEEVERALESEPDDADDDDWQEGEDEEAIDFRDPRHATFLTKEFGYDETLARKMEARGYQQKAIVDLLSGLRSQPSTPQLLHIATGGGKTFVANEIIAKWLEDRPGASVLWATKDWRLLWQAGRDLSRRHRGYGERITRIGGDGQWLHPLPESTNGSVIYTTLHTLQRRIAENALPRGFQPSLVVWDECHWGEHAKTGRSLLKWCKRRTIPVMGLTATPRSPDVSEFRVAYSRGFHELVMDKFLAKPRPLEPVRTNVEWSPERSNANSDFRQDSLSDLSRNRRRNELIVDHYASRAREYGKTIVFACNIEHADRLAELFTSRHGIPARSMHSEWVEHANRDFLEQFKSGQIQILVNVAMLTHGIDIPDAKTVFLCRPTLSDILFSQMIGRASRRDEASGKTEFFVVEFQDNLDRFGDQLVTAVKFFAGAAGAPERAPAADRVVDAGGQAVRLFDPKGAPTWIPDQETQPPALRGLWYRQRQTFGIEFELTSNDFSEDMPEQDWLRIAREVLRELETTLPGRVAREPYLDPRDPTRDHSFWNLVWDSTAGWEVTTPRLADEAGFNEVVIACAALERVAERLNLRVNHRTGTHIHLGWQSTDLEELKRAILLARLFEPAVATLVSPSRLVHFDGATYHLERPNEWCKPVSTVYPATRVARAHRHEDLYDMSAPHEARYVSFNIKPLYSQETVEVRLHGGTIEASKILLWVSLWMQILWAAGNRPNLWSKIVQVVTSRSAVREVADRDVIVPDGDVMKLAREFLPSVQQATFLRRLDERRRAILEIWRGRAELQPWVRYGEQW